MTDLTVRRFERGDGERVRELNEAAMAETPEYVPDAPDEDLRDVPGHYLVDGGEFLVGEVAGRLVATGAYRPLSGWKVDRLDGDHDGAAELTRVRVDPDHWGQGFGTAVYWELERRAAADGYRRFVLDTGAENERARGFYESLGFDCVGEVTVEFDGLALNLALYATALESRDA